MKILVIDDHADLLTLVSLILKGLGHESIVCESGIEGEHLALSEKPDVILLDIMMPIQDGWMTLDHLQQQGYTGRVVLMSAYPTNTQPLRALDKGARGYIRKPLSREKIAQVLGVTHRNVAVIETNDGTEFKER